MLLLVLTQAGKQGLNEVAKRIGEELTLTIFLALYCLLDRDASYLDVFNNSPAL
jgi:hypothetical protein